MKKIFILFCVIALSSGYIFSQDTFSIVAVDSATQEVGSAGASCIAGSRIISDVHPGKGAIHTQAYYINTNQNYAKSLMNAGIPPSQIIDSMIANDVVGNPSIRQYGVVDFDGAGGIRTAAYTGTNTNDYKNHIVGPYYTIQGNILLSQAILDSMESRFLKTTGSFACRLMSALQGANVPGADTRCMNDSTSSISAFIRVAKKNDVAGNYYIDINVNSTPAGVEPIDSLQNLFNTVLICNPDTTPDTTGISILEGTIKEFDIMVYPNPTDKTFTIKLIGNIEKDTAEFIITDLSGRQLKKVLFTKNEKNKTITTDLPEGLYLYKLIAEKEIIKTGKLVMF